jgi:hypothetical protein
MISPEHILLLAKLKDRFNTIARCKLGRVARRNAYGLTPSRLSSP